MAPNTQKRKRQKNDDGKSAGKKKRTKASKNKNRNGSKRGKLKVVDATYLYDSDDVEQPTEMDIRGYGALNPRDYPQRQPKESGNAEAATAAPPPEVPNHNDDDPDLVTVRFDTDPEDETGKKGKKRVKPTIVSRGRSSKPQPRSSEFVRPEGESVDGSVDEAVDGPVHGLQEPPQEPPVIRAAPSFMTMPAEIRDDIYRQLLTVNKPINVYAGWRMVYKRNKLDLPTSILRVNRQVHAEAARVLYGENTFLYRLRDPTTAVKNIDRLASDDTDPTDDEQESASEWEGAGAASAKSRARRRRNVRKPQWDINLDKYSHWFRSIAIEAEHNRYSEDTQNSMAKAINVFASTASHRKRKVEGEKKFNIRTLTIRVTPLWNPTAGEDGLGAFTFVDFFELDSPVLRAMESVECQFLRVDLLTRYMARSSLTPAESGACRLTVDRRHVRIFHMLGENSWRDDWWARDEVMKHRRVDMMTKSVEAIRTMARHIRKQCAERNFGMRTTEDCGDDAPLWDEIWDDDDDL